MCTVQVLLITDIMRPFPHEQVPAMSALRPISRSVCRRLFADELGPATDSGPFLSAALAELQRKDTEKWNFDFIAEKPLPGRYLWEPVCPTASRVPPTHVTDVRPTALPEDRPTTSRENLVTSQIEKSAKSQKEEPAKSLKLKLVNSHKSKPVTSRKRKQTTALAKSSSKQLKITDYLVHRKRPHTSQSSSPKIKAPRLGSHSPSVRSADCLTWRVVN